MRLSQLKNHQQAMITAIIQVNQDAPERASDHTINDVIARRLITLGFVPGEQVRVLARGVFGGDPILVQIGFTRFALRLAEAARIEVSQVGPHQIDPSRVESKQ